MDETMFRGDCAACVGLCCVLLAFDASERFSFDKVAGQPCRFLQAGRCTVHARRLERGMGGCVSYDCLGAGQGVTRLFGGHSRTPDVAQLQAMGDAYWTLRDVHELGLLLHTLERACAARGLALDPEREAQRRELWSRVCPPQGWTLAALAALDLGDLERRVRTFLSGLRGLGIARRRHLPVALPSATRDA